jgi:large subunit ribosomal protein L24
VKRHRKARTAEEQGGIVSFEAPIHSSNVMLLDPKSDAPTRTRRRIDTDGTKERLPLRVGKQFPAFAKRED